MKVGHLYTKIEKKGSDLLAIDLRLIYLRTPSGLEIIDEYLLDQEKDLEFLNKHNHLIAVVETAS